MDIGAALLAGAANKIYDDGIENKLITNPTHKALLETLQCFLLGSISANNFTFSLIMYLTNLINSLSNDHAFNAPYEFSLITLYPIFILLSFHTRTHLNTIDWIWFLGAMVFGLEPMVIKEEASPRKCIFRAMVAIFFTIISFLNLGLSRGTYLVMIYLIGYLAISSLFQFYLCVHMTLVDFNKQLRSGSYTLYTDIIKVLTGINPRKSYSQSHSQTEPSLDQCNTPQPPTHPDQVAVQLPELDEVNLDDLHLESHLADGPQDV